MCSFAVNLAQDFYKKGALPPFFVLLSLACWLVFANRIPFGSWADHQRLILLVVAATAALLAVRWAWCERVMPPVSVVVVAFGTGLLGLASALRAPDQVWALAELSVHALLVGLAASVMVWRRQRSAIWPETWLALLVVGIAFIVAYKAGVNYYKAFVVDGKLVPPLLVAGFSNIRVLGYVSTLWLPILAFPLMLSATQASRGWRVVSMVALVSLWLCVLVTGTRAAWLGMAAASVMLFWWGGLGRQWTVWQLRAVGLALAAYFLLFSVLPAWFGVEVVSVLGQRVLDSTDASRVLSGRDALYQLSFQLIGEHPWLGVGPMHFASFPQAIAGSPHNAVLHIAVEWGLPMLALVLGLGVVFARHMWRHGCLAVRAPLAEQPTRNPMVVCLLAALLATAVQSMFSGILAEQNSLLWLAVVVGWSLGLTTRPGAATANGDHPVVGMLFRWAVLLGTLACIGMLTHVVARDLPNLAFRERVYLQKYGLPLKPRFWRQGMIHP